MAGDFAAIVRPLLERRLAASEALLGVIAATHQRTFSGELYAIGVTNRRLLLQPLDRKTQAKGEPRSISPDALVSADIDGAGADWTPTTAVLGATPITIRLRTTDGEKLKLRALTGSGLIGGLAGGEGQREGVGALAQWTKRYL